MSRLRDAYRRSGADGPLGDRWAPHGVGVEGWYWRAADPASGRVVAVMLGIARGADGARLGNVVLAAHPGGIVREATTTDVEASPARLVLGGVAVATRHGVRAAIGDLAIELDLRDPRPLAPRLRGGLGAAHVLPGFPQHWVPFATDAAARLAVRGAGGPLHAHAAAYHEKNWGRRFPGGGWWWGAAHAFPEPRVAVAFAGGPLGRPLQLAPTAVVVRLPDGACLRLGTPLLSPVAAAAAVAEPDAVELDGRSPRHRVRLRARAGADDPGLLLSHPEPDGAIDRRARQHLAATVELVIEERRGARLRLRYRGTSALAGLERGLPDQVASR